MREYGIGVMVGTLRRDSIICKLAAAFPQHGPAGFCFNHIKIDDLPPYNKDADAHQDESVRRLKASIAASQGLIFLTPQYNRSIPGVLKNAIYHASQPVSESAWAGKPAGVMGVSVGSMGTSVAPNHLRNVLACLDVPILDPPDVLHYARDGFLDHTGNVEESTRNFLQQWLEQYKTWVEFHVP
jgi:chromate reductase, NAD(P)H dehydrogenase (quinone)